MKLQTCYIQHLQENLRYRKLSHIFGQWIMKQSNLGQDLEDISRMNLIKKPGMCPNSNSIAMNVRSAGFEPAYPFG